MSEEKKSVRRWKLWLIIGIIAIVSVGGLVFFGNLLQKPVFQSSSSVKPYVEVDYKTVGWFFDSTVLGVQNNTYFVLEVTIINKGYSQQVNCEPWNFDVTINGVSYDAWGLGNIPLSLYNGTTTTEYTYYTYTTHVNFASSFTALPNVKLANNAKVSGFIAFQISNPSLTNKKFTLSSSLTYGKNYLPAQIKIVSKDVI